MNIVVLYPVCRKINSALYTECGNSSFDSRLEEDGNRDNLMVVDKKNIVLLAAGLAIGFGLGGYSLTLKAPATFEECAVREGIGQATTEMAARIIADMCWDRFNKVKE